MQSCIIISGFEWGPVLPPSPVPHPSHTPPRPHLRESVQLALGPTSLKQTRGIGGRPGSPHAPGEGRQTLFQLTLLRMQAGRWGRGGERRFNTRVVSLAVHMK